MNTLQKEDTRLLSRKGACIAFFDAYSDSETGKMISLAKDDATVHFHPLGEQGKGSFWEFGRQVWQMLMDAFPDIDNTVSNMISEENSVRCEVVIFGTQERDFMDIPSKGLRFENDHIFVFHFDEEDQIVHLDIIWDHGDFVAQLTA